MAFGGKRSRGGDEYIFIDGRAMKADETVRIDVTETVAPGQEEAEVARSTSGRSPSARTRKKGGIESLSGDAFEIRDEFTEELASPPATSFMVDDRRKMHRKYLISAIVLGVIILFSLCISEGHNWTIYSPFDVLICLGEWVKLQFVHLTNPAVFAVERLAVIEEHSMYQDVVAQFGVVIKYLMCGALLAMSGMLYQNAFRNPIAAPSMLGVSNGMSIAMLILVMVFGEAAISMNKLYFIFSYVGGALILLLVLFGGKLMSGDRGFNVVNMLLMGTVISQLLGVVMTYVQNNFMTESQWLVYYEMQEAMTDLGIWSYVSLIFGLAISVIPIVVFRFRLNLISFSDDETRLLGVDPTKLRTLALVCGSFMILTAQVNAGQISMISLVVPFIARYIYGSEFRKQLVGNCFLGMAVLLVCADITSFVYIDYIELSLSSVVTIMATPLFVWMLAIQQRSWE